MKYERFEELPCWQKARELCKVIFELISKSPFSKDFGLKDQIWRASGYRYLWLDRYLKECSFDPIVTYQLDIGQYILKTNNKRNGVTVNKEPF